MRGCILWIFILGLSLSVAQVRAQDRGALIIAPTDSDDAVTLYARSNALVIGIDDYSDGWPRLSNAVRDAKAVAAELEQRGFGVQLITNPDSTKLRESIEQFVFERGSDPEARLFIWFAGHGHTVDGEGYLVPAGAPGPEAGWRFRQSALSLRSFGRYMREVRSKHVLAVFDSCFAGTVFNSARSRPPVAITRATTQPVRQFVSSGEAEQVVSDDGTFRKLFVDALNGLEPHADANRDGYITGSELGLFLSDRVTTLSNGTQTPRYGKLNALQLDRGDFVFSITRDSRAAELPMSAKPEDPEEPAAPVRPALKPDAVAWSVIQNTGSEAVLQAFVDEFPDSIYAKFARARLAEMRRVAALPEPSDMAPEEPETAAECDKLAAHPGDETRPPDTGVDFEVLEQHSKAAVAACRQAAAKNPDNTRFTFQLARALQAAEKHSEAFELYKNAADAGHVSAFYNLGLVYEHGSGTKRDLKEAFRWYSKGADRGYSYAVNSLAAMYQLGKGVSRDIDEAVRLYQKAAEDGNTLAMNNLGFLYSEGNDVRRDPDAAVHWFRKAAEAGDALGMSNLGYTYERGEGVPRDLTEAIRLYRTSAEKGSTFGMTNLANMYEQGLGVPRDYYEALRLYREAAELGDSRGMAGLGILYETGRGVARDPAEAARWYRKAVEIGHIGAMTSLGVLYEHGTGVTRDLEEAVRLYRQAAEKGDARGMGNLGTMYALGTGVALDLEEGIRWFRKAAAKGDAYAMNNLGFVYGEGKGVTRDDQESLRWYRQAADLGHPPAMTNVGVAYEFGKGVKRDYAEAARWYRKAADMGDPHGLGNLGGLYNAGRGVARDAAEAARLIAQALKLGYAFSLEQMTTNSNAWGQDFRMEMQRILKSEGVYDGAIDGSFGPATKRAIRKLAGKT